MSSSTYRQLVLRLPDGLKETMRDRVAADMGLEGVDFTPVKKGSRRFSFTMDGKVYPARLVDLPCVLETQKTLDRSTFFKSGDVGQMLIVYKDENAYKKDDSNASGSGNPQAFYPDGITPPTRNIVKRRFLRARPDQGKFDRTEVIRVESQVLKMQQDGTDGPDRNKKRSGGGGVAGGGGGSSSRSSSSRSRGSSGGADGSKAGIARSGGGGSSGNGGGGGGAGAGTAGGGGDGSGERVTFEHEEIVTFEPWMADPDIAAVGRLEGITIEVTGATEKAESGEPGGRRGASGAVGSIGTGVTDAATVEAPRLFGSELLYEHPEVLLAMADVPEDPTLKPPPPKPKPAPSTTKLSASKKKQQANRGSRATAQASPAAPAAPKGPTPGAAVAALAVSAAAAAAAASAAAAAAVSAVTTGTDDLDADVASAVMDDMNDAEDVLGVEDIFSGLPGELQDGASAWPAEDDSGL